MIVLRPTYREVIASFRENGYPYTVVSDVSALYGSIQRWLEDAGLAEDSTGDHLMMGAGEDGIAVFGFRDHRMATDFKLRFAVKSSCA